MRLCGRIEPGSGVGLFPGQPCFLANSGSSPELYLILGAVISTGLALRMEVVAEVNAAAFLLAEVLIAKLVAAVAAGAVSFSVLAAEMSPGLSLRQPVRVDNKTVTAIRKIAINLAGTT